MKNMTSENKNLQRAYFSSIKPALSLYIFIGLIQSCAAFLVTVSIGEFFKIHFHSHSSKGRLLHLFGIKPHTLYAFFLLFIILLLIRTLFEFLERWISYQQGELYAKHIREKIFPKQISWSQEKFQEKHFGKYLLRYSNDMKSVQNYLTKGIMGAIKDGCFVLMGFVLLWIIHHLLAIYLLIMTAIFIVIIFIISKLQKNMITASRNERSKLLAFVTRSFHRHKSIKERSMEEATKQRFNGMSDLLYTANMHNNQFESMLQALLTLLQYSIIGILLWLMSLSSSSIGRNDALVFILITLMLISPMKRLLKVPAVINKGKISFGKINEIINSSTDLNQGDEATAAGHDKNNSIPNA
ncbi:ABC transporter transmembrane domain-containing protein [Flavobacterium sp. AED]|jgi:ABC-type multidrug transport system fused ATPase/permease subunit|uniref:ABC transporter transmembrane domain-containing protein n=1 Tax=Flavobacterium sp. AED TaxID=1423323 RepID=UPI0005807056|nr:ABC transporter transmembrane domain-containing protein [Flavobacterium sp. AED]KIA82428.1 hypothetical protein OA85_16305 [Flavobacterium sp. AED]